MRPMEAPPRSARRRVLLLVSLLASHLLAFIMGYNAHGSSVPAAAAGYLGLPASLSPATGGEGARASPLSGSAQQSAAVAARAQLRTRLASRAASRTAVSPQQVSLRPSELANVTAAAGRIAAIAAAAQAAEAAATAPPAPLGAGYVVDLGLGGGDKWLDKFKPHARDNSVVYTWTNLSMKDFLLMFLLNLKRHGITSFVIGAMDPELRAWLDEKAPALGMVIPVLTLNAGLTTGDFGWNSPSFKRMAKYKFQAVQQMLSIGGWDVVVADTDTAWLRNPLPYFAARPDPDILTSTDVLRRMPLKEQFHSTLNIGVMVFRARPGAVAFVTAFYTEMVEDPKFGSGDAEWDQARFNRMVREGMDLGPREQEWAAGWGGRVKVQALDIVDFPNGHVYFAQRLPQQLGIVPYIVHATFQYGGTTGKRHRFREWLAWGADPPEYYAPPAGLLSYSFVNDPALLAVANSSVEAHFALMNPQLEALRSAWGVARALGRVLVMPQFTCGMDRVWFPHDGVFPGSDPIFTIPFTPCPMDHMLDTDAMDRRGLLDQIREYSLLSNPLMPATTVASAAKADWGAAAGVAADGTRLLPFGATAAQVVELLAPLKAAALIAFASMPPGAASFGGWPAGDAEGTKFFEDMRPIGSQWCCINEQQAKERGQKFPPGQVWYDMLVNVVPHTDRHGRKWDGPFKIMLGP